jgi:ABC-2 type transport system ATP-binding protein
MLELSNIKKYYNKNLVLDIPFLQLENGIYWVKGANGSGKTTLLKMIAGLLPFQGDILFKDISLKNKSLAYRQNISWAEAEPLFPAFMSGQDLLSLYQNIRKVTQKEVNFLLEFFNMTQYINSAIGTYSAGKTKKLSLVMAFMGNPALILLDEPFITLDADAFNLACTFIAEKNKNSGTAFLMSSHQDLNLELSLSGREITVSNKTITVE